MGQPGQVETIKTPSAILPNNLAPTDPERACSRRVRASAPRGSIAADLLDVCGRQAVLIELTVQGYIKRRTLPNYPVGTEYLIRRSARTRDSLAGRRRAIV